MPVTCTAATSPHSCGHYVITIGGRTLHLHQSDLTALSDEELDVLYRLAVRHKGVALAQLLNRTVLGDEFNNMKIYNFFGPGAAITKTNIGTSYVNIPIGANGERVAVDFAGCTEYRIMLHANLVGSGQWGARIVRDSDLTVLHENANLGAAGERELDTDWQTLPAAFVGQGLVLMRAQAKSTTGADDPVFRGLRLGLR